MANKNKKKVRINKEGLYELIGQKTSIRKLGPMIDYNEKTIRRGLDDCMMSIELVFAISSFLCIDPNSFAYLDSYYEGLVNILKRPES